MVRWGISPKVLRMQRFAIVALRLGLTPSESRQWGPPAPPTWPVFTPSNWMLDSAESRPRIEMYSPSPLSLLRIIETPAMRESDSATFWSGNWLAWSALSTSMIWSASRLAWIDSSASSRRRRPASSSG